MDSNNIDKIVDETLNNEFDGTMDSYIKNILLECTGNVVKSELNEEQLRNIVNRAFSELKHYIADTRTVTVPYNDVIDTSKLNVNISAIQYLMRGQSSTKYMPVQDVMFYYSNGINQTSYGMEDYARGLMTQQNLANISTDLDFYYDKPNKKLFVNCNTVKPTSLTIEYIPEYTRVEDITESYWQNLLKRFSVAFAKQIYGRIRSKYTLNSSQYTIDGPTMLSEGNQELETIRTILKENNDTLFVID